MQLLKLHAVNDKGKVVDRIAGFNHIGRNKYLGSLIVVSGNKLVVSFKEGR